MELKCEAVCTKVYKKSSSPAFKNLQVGDIINFSTEIKHARSCAIYINALIPKQTKQVSYLSIKLVIL